MPKMTGFLAWIIWVGLHVATLLGNRNRFATMTNLTAKYLTRGSHNAIVGETPYVTALARRHRRGPARTAPLVPAVRLPATHDDDDDRVSAAAG